MQRYIAFAWNPLCKERTALARTLVRRLKLQFPEWQCAMAVDGLHVYHTGNQARSSLAYPLGQNAGVILGKVFHRHRNAGCDPHEVTFNTDETQKVRDTAGRHLVEHYWGRYVALLRGDDGAHVWILRDPTGAVPCLLTRFQEINIVCSHIEDTAALELIDRTINWDHVAAYLWYKNMATEETGLSGVRQVQAGESVAVVSDNDSMVATFHWSPDQFSGVCAIEDRQQAMRELRDTIRYCVSAWASCYDNILLGLSGGLDSAVVLACLSETSGEPKVVCENYYTQTPQGDERFFARKAANLAGVELIETPFHSSDLALETMLDSRKCASPTQTSLVHPIDSIREEIIGTRGIEAVFSGQGGDHFFQELDTPLIAAEYAWHHGLRPELLRVIADTARFTRKPFWSVAATVLTSGLFHRREDPYDQLRSPPLLSDQTRDALDPRIIRHPWVGLAEHLPGSKLLQIFNIIDSQHFFFMRSHYADLVHPLISQPIVELCLQIPSYILTYGGIDRALVRDAFTEMVPPEITHRTIKGATTAYMNSLFTDNLPFLRQYLLDGLLTGEGILDRKKTAASLTESALIGDPCIILPILCAVRAESWLRGWMNEGRRAAA